MPTPASSPVVVIGAGLAGLAASLRLARDGHPVTLLEAGAAPGGCCASVEVDGFRFNTGAVYMAAPSLLRAGFQRLGLDPERELTLLPVQRPHETHLQDGVVVHLADARTSRVEGPRAAERTAMLRDGLAALQRHWGPVYRTLIAEVLPHPPSPWRALWRLGRYLPRMGGHADALIARFFPDAGLQAAVASTLLYTGLPPERLPATQIIGLIALLEEGFHLPSGGMGAVSAALARRLGQVGVTLRLGARVEHIETADGAVRGVVLAGGERLAAGRVVATCSGFELARRLLPAAAVPRRVARAARRAPLSHRAVSIQLGCSGAAMPSSFVVNHVPDMAHQGLLHQAQPDVPQWLAYTVLTQVQPDLAPAGKSIIELYAPVSGIAHASEWTPAMTRQAVDFHMEALRRRLPGLQIETSRVLDPNDFARQRHLYEGALYGVAPGTAPDRLFPHRTGLRGLYLAGQSTFPGYGAPTAIWSGIHAAEAMLRHEPA